MLIKASLQRIHDRDADRRATTIQVWRSIDSLGSLQRIKFGKEEICFLKAAWTPTGSSIAGIPVSYRGRLALIVAIDLRAWDRQLAIRRKHPWPEPPMTPRSNNRGQRWNSLSKPGLDAEVSGATDIRREFRSALKWIYMKIIFSAGLLLPWNHQKRMAFLFKGWPTALLDHSLFWHVINYIMF